mgnify:FL=1
MNKAHPGGMKTQVAFATGTEGDVYFHVKAHTILADV